MRAYIGADSLAFLSIDGLYRAMGEEARSRAAAIHRPLLHGRLPDAPQLTDLAVATPRRLAMLAEAD